MFTERDTDDQGFDYSDGSASYYGGDGSQISKNADGSGSYYGADGSSELWDTDECDSSEHDETYELGDESRPGLGTLAAAGVLLVAVKMLSKSEEDDDDESNEEYKALRMRE